MIRLRIAFQLHVAWPPRLELPKLAKAKRLPSGTYPAIDTTGDTRHVPAQLRKAAS